MGGGGRLRAWTALIIYTLRFSSTRLPIDAHLKLTFVAIKIL